ncbi:MAG: molybdopterin converting factor subunit 1 [Steroidobacteraceae bacterium]
MKIRYFAWLRHTMGCDEEDIALPAEVKTVGMLLDWLPTCGERHARALEFIDMIMVSVNQQYADRQQPLIDTDEVLLIPPISGG